MSWQLKRLNQDTKCLSFFSDWLEHNSELGSGFTNYIMSPCVLITRFQIFCFKKSRSNDLNRRSHPNKGSRLTESILIWKLCPWSNSLFWVKYVIEKENLCWGEICTTLWALYCGCGCNWWKILVCLLDRHVEAIIFSYGCKSNRTLWKENPLTKMFNILYCVITSWNINFFCVLKVRFCSFVLYNL